MGLSGYFVFNGAIKGGGTVLVPDVTGLPVTSAANLLAEVGLELGEQKQVMSDRVPEYHVIIQRPRPNRVVRAGRKVTLSISAGRQYEDSPSLVGKPLQDALETIRGTRLRSGSIARMASDAPADTILAQDPEPRAHIESGGEVHLLISDGPEARPLFMPQIVGASLDEAQISLAKLNVAVVPFRVERPGEEYEVVLAQNPSPGTLLHEGQEVSFDIRVLPSTFLPNARRKVDIAYSVPRVRSRAAVKVQMVDQRGAPTLLYPQPQHYVRGRPPTHAGGTSITVPQVAISGEVTVEFYLDGALHTSYYFKGSDDPVITVNEIMVPKSAPGGLVEQEEIDLIPRATLSNPFGRRPDSAANLQ